MLYTYHRIELRDAQAASAQAFSEWIGAESARKAAEAGGELLGLFLPQLGWASHERALLFRWPKEEKEALAGSPLITAIRTDRLAATARPGDADRPAPGGIFVHRWFVIDPKSRNEFIELSTGAWTGFERDFRSGIFGLFAVEPTPPDGASQRMLLITRYDSHADWEASRRPPAESAERFRRRHQLTRSTIGCSTILAPRG